jgi:hypothetical protein
MKNVVDLTGFLHLVSTALTQVNGLANLKTVGGGVSINSNASLQTIAGLGGLETITSGLSIQSNTILNPLALTKLKSVGGDFYLYNNAQLATVGGLAALTTIGGYLNIQSNPALVNLTGLNGLTSIGTDANDYLQIYGNSGLQSIAALAPTTLAGNLTVSQNGQLPMCQAEALKAALTTGGWNKTYSQSGNLACASPKVCVAGVCQN